MNNLRKLINNTQASLSHILAANGWLLFVLFCLVLWLFVFVNSEFIVTEQLYDQYVESRMQEKYDDYDELATEFEEDLEDYEDESAWTDTLFDFGFVTIQNLFQFAIISIFLYVGMTIRQYNEEISYGSIFKVVMVSEFVFFIPKLVKYGWFSINSGRYSFTDVQSFSPFSLLGLLQPLGGADWMVYPLRFLNIFELLYIGILILGVSSISGLRIQKVSSTVVIAYLTLMMLWIAMRIYLSTIF